MAESEVDCECLLEWGRSFSGRDALLTTPRRLKVRFSVRDIACSDEHCLFLTLEGRVFAQGGNAHGCLGVGGMRAASGPVEVRSLGEETVQGIACGPDHSLAVTDRGELYAWGVGEYGVLGLGHTADQPAPALVSLPGKAVAVSTGARHTVALGDQGQTWGCGLNAWGQLGLGHTNSQVNMVPIRLPDEVEQVACGVSHTLFLTRSRLVYAAGSNSLGQLGLPHCPISLSPAQVATLSSEIVKITAGSHSAALTTEGDLYVWGTGPFGTMLNPTKFNPNSVKVKAVDVGTHFGMAEDVEGNLWTWGSNTSGQLGLGDFRPKGRMTKSPLSLATVQLLRLGGASVIAVLEVSERNETSKRGEEPAAFPSPRRLLATANPSIDTVRSQCELSRLRQTVESLENELRQSYKRAAAFSKTNFLPNSDLVAKELELELSDSLRLNDELVRKYKKLRVSHEEAERELMELARELAARDRAVESLSVKYSRLKDAQVKLKTQNTYLMKNLKEEQSAKDRLKSDFLSLERQLDQSQKREFAVSALQEAAKAFERENVSLRKDISVLTSDCRQLEQKLVAALADNSALKSDLIRVTERRRREEGKEERKPHRKGSDLETIEEGSSRPQSSGKRYSDPYLSPSDFAPCGDALNLQLREADETELRSPEEEQQTGSALLPASSLRNSLSELTSKSKEWKRSRSDLEQRKVVLERKLMSRDSEGEE